MPGPLDILVPEVNPSGAPDDYQRISTSPNMFGAFRGEAAKEFGHGLTTASDAAISYLTEQNQLNDQTHASEVHSWGVDQGLDLTSAHMELSGRAAQDNLPVLKEKLRGIQQDAESQAGNLYTKSLVSQNLRRSFDYMIEKATSHATSELTKWRTQVAGNNATTATDVGSLAIQGGGGIDFGKLDEQIGVVNAEAHNHFDQHYDDLDDPEQKNALSLDVSKMKGQTVKNWVETAMTNPKDPDNISHALQIFERYTGQIDPGSRLAIDKYVKVAADKRRVTRLSDYFSIQEGHAVDQTLSPEMRGLLDTIHGSETPGGGYDTMYGGQSVERVKPGFDYSDHPRVMTPAAFGPTSAFGRYQITKTTWDENRDKFNLTDISPASQDKFAAQLASQRYAKAYQGEAFKQFGELSGNLDQDLQEHKDNPKFLAAVGQALSGEWTSLPGGLQVNAQTASFVQRFQKNIAINRGEAQATPDPAIVAQRIMNDPLFQGRPELQQEVLQATLAKVSMMNRADALQQKALKDASDDEKNKMFFAIRSNHPVTLDDIQNNPRLLAPAKDELIKDLQSWSGEEQQTKMGADFHNLFDRIHLPEGDPDRLTSADEIYAAARERRITTTGAKELATELFKPKTPESEAEGALKKTFLAIAQAHIAPSNPMGIKMPRSEEDFQRFQGWFFPTYEKLRAGGPGQPPKTPQQLLTPGTKDKPNPDYMGNFEPFTGPLAKQYYDYVTQQQQMDFGATPNVPGQFDITKIKTADDAIAAYKANNITRDQARVIVIAHPEWGITLPAPAPAMPIVPMSQ